MLLHLCAFDSTPDTGNVSSKNIEQLALAFGLRWHLKK